MAERRMLAKKLTDDDDDFIALSSTAQALYLHLSMSADDDGFCNQISISMFKAHASVQDLQTLLEKRYIYQFDSGVIVIRHWRMANALRKDRYTPTVFQNELSMLSLKDNGTYTWLPDGCQTVAVCLPQDRIGKDRIGKDSVDEDYYLPPEKQIQEDVGNCVENYVETDKCQELSAVPLLEIQNLYNSICVSFPKIETIEEKTKNAISQIWQKYKDIDIFKKVFTIAERSDFLKGKKTSWKANFEWLMRLSNFDNVLGGKYNDFEKPKERDGSPSFDLDEFYELAVKRGAGIVEGVSSG